MFVLLLLLSLNGQPQVTKIENFRKAKLCQEAGEWLQQNMGKPELNDGKHFFLAGYACVQVK